MSISTNLFLWNDVKISFFVEEDEPPRITIQDKEGDITIFFMIEENLGLLLTELLKIQEILYDRKRKQKRRLSESSTGSEETSDDVPDNAA